MFFKKKEKVQKICAYANGKAVPVTEVDDEVFGSGCMGDGVAIYPSGNMIYAPCDGKISLIAETKHAIAIELPDTTQVLIHIGLDSAVTKAENFEVLVAVGDQVQAGDEMVRIAESIMNGLVVPMVIIENPEDYKIKPIKLHEAVSGGEEIVQLVK